MIILIMFYVFVAMSVWPFIAMGIYKNTTGYYSSNMEKKVFTIIMGLFVAAAWPIGIPASGIFYVMKRMDK